MTWIPSYANLKEHPKRKRLSRLLKLDMYQTIGLLNCLWWWAMNYAPDGNLEQFDAADIADGIDYAGDPDELIKVLQDSGFLDGFELHDWLDYGGKLLVKRETNAQRMREKRAAESENESKHKDDTCAERAAHVQGTCRARGEERRGEEKTTEGGENSGDPTRLRLLTLAIDEIPPTESTEEDFAKVINRQLNRGCGAKQIERIIYELADWWPSNSGKRKQAHRSLQTWLQKEEPVPDAGDYTDTYPTADVPDDWR